MIKKIIYLFFCVSFSLLSYAQETNPNGYNFFFFPNGKLSSEGTLQDGKPDKYWKNYHKNGKLKSEGNRLNFLLDSVWKFYDENGALINTYTYKEGKKNGTKNNYNVESGKLESTENYETDLKHGFTYYFYGRDSVWKKIPFDKGKEHGTGYEYEKDGRIITIFIYKNGFLYRAEKINRRDANGLKQGNWKEFYTNGNVSKETKYENDKKNGYYKEYNEKGEVTKTIKYINDIEITDAPELVKLDVNYDYYDDGRPKKIFTTKNGVKEGVERDYSDSGTVIASKIFKEGKLQGDGIVDLTGKKQGHWKEFYDEGPLKAEGSYIDGIKVGDWTYYHANGAIEQKGKYTKKGIQDGLWKWYYDNKQVRREETFIKGKEEGDFIEYAEDGSIINKGTYFDGFQDGPWYSEYGDYKEEGEYKNGNKSGEWKGYYRTNGKLAFVGKFLDGSEDGRHIWYYDNGAPRLESVFLNGKREGTWNYYEENGFLLLTEVYENDVLIKIDGKRIKNEE